MRYSTKQVCIIKQIPQELDEHMLLYKGKTLQAGKQSEKSNLKIISTYGRLLIPHRPDIGVGLCLLQLIGQRLVTCHEHIVFFFGM